MKSILFRATLALCLLIYVGIGAFAQHSETTGSIVGTVVDASTHEALPYVQIIVKGTTVGTTTDANGAFILPNLRPGTYILEVRLLGYALESSGVAVQAGHGRHHDFYLRQQAIDLDGVVISANRHETMRRSAPSLVTVLSQEIFQKTHSENLSQGLRFQPGLRIEDNC